MNQRITLLKQGLWFFLFNSILLLLIATRYFKYFSETDSFLTAFYISITTISHFVGLSFLLIVLYIPIIFIVPYKTAAWIWAGVLSIVSSVCLLIDTFIFDLYRIHINKFILELLFGGGGSQIFVFDIKQYLMLAGLIILFLVTILYLSYLFFHWNKVLFFNKGIYISVTIAIMMLASHFIHAWADASNYIPITKSSRYYPLFFPATDRDLMLELGLVDKIDSDNNLQQFANSKNNDLKYPQHAIVSDTACKTNVIFILIDSWYYKSFDAEVMPNIFDFSKKCAVYTHHYSGSNGTRTGIFSLFYSIPGTYWNTISASQTRPVFMDLLLKNRYQINTFTSASLTNPPFDRTVFSNIKNIHLETPGTSVSDRDVQITKDVMAQTAHYDPSHPFFSFVFYDALHAFAHPADYKGPFQPEWEYPKYELLNNDMDATPFLNLYKNSAHYTDSLVGIVLRDLEKKKLLDNSWVIITGDHGQEFNDNKKNYWGHNGNYTSAQMQVPLLIYKPNGDNKTYTHWTSHYDIVPTIATELFSCKNPIGDYSIGRMINDTASRDWLLVGSSDNFAILQPNKISSIYFDGSYDITDSQLNPIKDAKLQPDLINKIMNISNAYYSK